MENAKNKSPVIFVTLLQNELQTSNVTFQSFIDDDTGFKHNLDEYYLRMDFIRKLPEKYQWVKVADFARP